PFDSKDGALFVDCQFAAPEDAARRPPMKKLSWSAVLATVVGIGCLGALNDGAASAETLYVQGSSGFSNDVLEEYQARLEARSGELRDSRERRGPDLPSHIVSLGDGGGTKRTTEAILLGGQHITPRSAIIVESAQEVIQTGAQDRGALGITQARLVKLHRLP